MVDTIHFWLKWGWILDFLSGFTGKVLGCCWTIYLGCFSGLTEPGTSTIDSFVSCENIGTKQSAKVGAKGKP